MAERLLLLCSSVRGVQDVHLRSRGDWLKPHRAMLETVHAWEHKFRRPASLLDPQAFFEHFNRLVPAGSVLAEMLADIDRQLAFLFRPGFLRGADLWQRYPRYFKALAVRLDRLKLDPFKDRTKWETVRPHQDLLDETLAALAGQPLPHARLRFATLLQEFRISQFAPEVGTLEKVSPKILQTLWSDSSQPGRP
jgi:hypothetical protein